MATLKDRIVENFIARLREGMSDEHWDGLTTEAKVDALRGSVTELASSVGHRFSENESRMPTVFKSCTK